MNHTHKGIFAAILSNSLFAILFLYATWMKPMNGTEVFAWRMVAMWFALVALMSGTKSWGKAARFCRQIGTDWRKWLLIVLPTPILASQLWLFIWAPVNGEAVNVAMGYFLFPLTMMLGGRLFFAERLNSWQRVAVGLAVLGVLLSLTDGFSWATLWVCGTYPAYYLLRRKMNVPSLLGLMLDLSLIAPCMLLYLILFSNSWAMMNVQPALWLLVLALGINSALAMYFNLQANQLLSVSLFGMMSYLEPILLFVIAVLWLGEPLGWRDLCSYGLIWLGICVMIWDGWQQKQPARSST